jgi:hypothetical protein
MHARVYGALVAKPIAFPNDLEIRLFPHRSRDDSRIGGFHAYEDHRSWDWVRDRYPMNSDKEARIRAGECIRLHLGWIEDDFPEGTKFTEESEFEILEPQSANER